MPSFLKALLTVIEEEKDDVPVVSSVVKPDQNIDYTSTDRVLTAAELDAVHLWELKNNEEFSDI